MITPRFELSQTDNTVTINIRAPYCSLRDLEVSVEDTVFIFLCRPFYLRLHLPGSIEENDNCHSSFDPDSGQFTFTYDKMVPGEHFPKLDLITTLLRPKIVVHSGNKKIEVLTSDGANEAIIETDEKYGFAMQGGYEVESVMDEYGEFFRVHPLEIKLENRRNIRLQHEKQEFDREHYLADLFLNEEIKTLLIEKCRWESLDKSEITFAGHDLDFLKNLTNIEYNLNEEQQIYSFNMLLDILYAYCYERRTTSYEGNCESGWTINTLSASITYFEGFKDPKNAIISAFRRSLIYPLYRSFELSQAVFKDLKKLLALGEKFILKCLLEIYTIFLNGDSTRYVINNMFIEDYLIYITKWNNDAWMQIIDEVNNLKIEKSDLNLGLCELELIARMNNLAIIDSDSDDSTTDSDDSSDSD